MTIVFHRQFDQGSDDWIESRRGILTASEMKHIITPSTLKYAQNEKERAHLYELAAQVISGYVEPQYISDDMLRGMTDEVEARRLYAKKYDVKVDECGFITNDKWGFKIGYSPDGLIGEEGQIECKSRRQKFQIQTIINDEAPDEFIIQVQTGLMVTGRKWCDYITYSAGLPMATLRVYPNEKMFEAIGEAAEKFYLKLNDMVNKYAERLLSDPHKYIPTERKKPEGEITV